MVKKLFKHEILAYLRIWLPMQIILIGIAAIGRFVQFFEAQNATYGIVNGSSIFAYVIAILVAFGLSYVFSITRFYKNLFTGEGYLSFTLPVTPTQHIVVKALTATLFQVLTFFSVIISFSVITAGDVFIEIVKAAVYLIKQISIRTGFHLPFFTLEVILMLIISALCNVLLFYACIAIGQTFRKNRALGAVIVFFAYYFISQILGTILTLFIMVLYPVMPMDSISQFINNNPLAFTHIVFCFMLVSSLIMAAIYFIITKVIIHKKLNLE